MTTLYRMFDAAGDLLYVGITSRGGRRFDEHAKVQPWWVEVASVTVEHFATRTEALAAELAAIRVEDPTYNAAGRELICDRCGRKVPELTGYGPQPRIALFRHLWICGPCYNHYDRLVFEEEMRRRSAFTRVRRRSPV